MKAEMRNNGSKKFWPCWQVVVGNAFKDFVVGDLFNTEGFPASSFRTDDW